MSLDCSPIDPVTPDHSKTAINPDRDCAQLVQEFLDAAALRATTERQVDSQKETAVRLARSEFAKFSEELDQLNGQISQKIVHEKQSSLSAENSSFVGSLQALEEQSQNQLKQIRQHLQKTQEHAEKERDERIWHASTQADSRKTAIEGQFNALRRRKNEMTARLETLVEQWIAVGVSWPESDHDENESDEVSTAETPLIFGSVEAAPNLDDHEATVAALELKGRKVVGFLPRKLFKIFMIPVWTTIGGGIGLAAGLSPIIPAGGLFLLAVAGFVIANILFRKKAEQAVADWGQINAEVDSLDEQLQFWRDSARLAIDQELDESREKASELCESATRLAQADAESESEKCKRQFQSSKTEITTSHEIQLKQIEQTFDNQLLEHSKQVDAKRIDLNQQFQQKLTKADSRQKQLWNGLRQDWLSIAENMQNSLTGWIDWQQSRAPVDLSTLDLNLIASQRAGFLSMGHSRVSVEAVPDLISADTAMRDATPSLNHIPVTWALPGAKSTLWIQAPPGRRHDLIAMLQTLSLRVLTAFPPGQARFTLIDPVGLGQTFAGLLHLGDFEPALVNQRPWSEARDIEMRLSELTAHLEFVVQNYLRNQYATIEDYNRDAGEVAEAYRVLVLADYPNGISDDSARRLRRLIEAGARCGIYVILGQDMSQTGTIDPAQAELRTHIDRVVWSNDKGRWSWPGNPLDRFEIQWDTPPDAPTVTKVVREIGSRAKTAMRVEVPFSVVAPQEGQIWSQSTARGIDIPLGRAGARQFQSIKLGEGTSQHVLLAGRTGSGKSTLLHAIVTNAALRYSPDELELYLIDFKKGVEFKNYATRELPHARVVAVESEREFGLSVLERLDRELTDRGEKFRKAGVQDVAGYRQAATGDPLPRIMLVVDEFQELFNEDDRISSDAAGLLDRLVRQGRAFGIHAVLGSQSMAGAYAIARSTMGQMGVRIALQCNENDSRLILSEDNPAARMLSRPGEAIYNDANGLVEGNHLFQAVWISDQDREQRLASIHATAALKGWQRPEPMIVFEGQAVGDLSRNKKLKLAFAHINECKPNASPVLWLGETVTISDPPAIRLDRQTASNILVVGRQGPEIRAMLTAGLLSISATSPATNVIIVESPAAGESGLANLVNEIPLHTQRIAPADLKTGMTELWNDLHARQDDHSKAENPIVFVVSDIARLRELRKSDDDYGFGGFGGSAPVAPSPTKMLSEILRDGPAVGIHTVLWTDGAVSMQNTTERNVINEFGTIVIFQSTAADSTHFLDSVAATRLQRWQALLVRPAESESIKIRPYGLAEPKDLNTVRRQNER